jgi:hypothetical protein
LFVLQLHQLEYSISLPFMPRHRLATERIYQFQLKLSVLFSLITKFRLNDMVVIVNLVIHVEMANGGIGTKRSEVILETLIWLKRIQLFAFETPTKFV